VTGARFALAAAAALVATAVPALAQRPLPASAYGVPWQRVNNEDRQFVREILLAGYFAIDMGRLAAQNASMAAVRRSGAALVRDSRMIGAALRALADRKYLKTPYGLDPAHTARLDRIVGSSGAAFDRAYLATLAAHRDDEIRACDTELANGTDPDLRAFARRLRARLALHVSRRRPGRGSR
jgi:putative membrane protein